MNKQNKCPECGHLTVKKYCPRCGSLIPQEPIYKKLHKATYIVGILWILGSISIASEQLKEMSMLEYMSTLLIGLIILTTITQKICETKRRKRIARESSVRTPANISDNHESKIIESNKSYDAMDGHEFEYYCAALLRQIGFANVEVTKGSGDQGIDILATKDDVKYGIQCKCYSSDIGNKAVQEAFAGKTFYGCHVAVVLTNRYFTPAAKELAKKNDVILWDRDKLNDMISHCSTT